MVNFLLLISTRGKGEGGGGMSTQILVGSWVNVFMPRNSNPPNWLSRGGEVRRGEPYLFSSGHFPLKHHGGYVRLQNSQYPCGFFLVYNDREDSHIWFSGTHPEPDPTLQWISRRKNIVSGRIILISIELRKWFTLFNLPKTYCLEPEHINLSESFFRGKSLATILTIQLPLWT